MFTGLYPHQAKGILLEDKLGVRGPETTGVIGDMMTNDASLREQPTFTDLLKERGYYTGYAGKWHLGVDVIGDWFDDYHGEKVSQYLDWLEENDLPDGWPLTDSSVRTDRVPHMSIPKAKINDIDPEHTNDAWIADHCIRRIKERPADKPFFISCGFNGPHPPFKIPEPYYSLYDPELASEPDNFKASEEEPNTKKGSFYRALWNDHGSSWKAWQKSVAVYWGFCTFIDYQVGRLVDCLKSEGVYEDTLVVYCSDHGEMLGQHGLWHKMQAYEEALRVPLIFSAPWFSRSIDTPALASLLDIPSTILSIAGVEIPEQYEGIDLSPGFCSPDWRPERTYVYSEHKPLGEFHGETDWRMVADTRYKYVWNNGDRNEFYDLEADPLETQNLIHMSGTPEHAEMRNALGDWMRTTDDPLASTYRDQIDA